MEIKNMAGVLYYTVAGETIVGPAPNMIGDYSNLYGECELVRGDCTGLKGDCSHIWGKVTEIRGDVSGLIGNCSFLKGDVTGIYGDCTGLTGDCSKLSGDVTGMMGNVTGLFGDCTGLAGNLDKCGLSEQDRAKGVDIRLLVSPATKMLDFSKKMKDQSYPRTEEIVAICKEYVGEKWWPDDSWLWFPPWAFNLVTNDVTHEEYIVVYPMENGDANTSMGIHITVKVGKEGR